LTTIRVLAGSSPEDLAARLSHRREVLELGDVGRDLHEAREIAAGRAQDPA